MFAHSSCLTFEPSSSAVPQGQHALLKIEQRVIKLDTMEASPKPHEAHLQMIEFDAMEASWKLHEGHLQVSEVKDKSLQPSQFSPAQTASPGGK